MKWFDNGVFECYGDDNIILYLLYKKDVVGFFDLPTKSMLLKKEEDLKTEETKNFLGIVKKLLRGDVCYLFDNKIGEVKIFLNKDCAKDYVDKKRNE